MQLTVLADSHVMQFGGNAVHPSESNLQLQSQLFYPMVLKQLDPCTQETRQHRDLVSTSSPHTRREK